MGNGKGQPNGGGIDGNTDTGDPAKITSPRKNTIQDYIMGGTKSPGLTPRRSKRNHNSTRQDYNIIQNNCNTVEIKKELIDDAQGISPPTARPRMGDSTNIQSTMHVMRGNSRLLCCVQKERARTDRGFTEICSGGVFFSHNTKCRVFSE